MNCVLLLMCWCDIRAAEQSSTKPFIWAGKCVRVSDRQRVPGVPGHRRGPLRPSYPFHPLVLPLSLSLSHTLFSALYSHLITFEQRHAGLFIEEWCFFISLCLFVALRSTEGFLAADVSSAALQRHGWNVEEKRGKRKDTKWQRMRQKRGMIELRMHDIWVLAEHLHETSQGEVKRVISVCGVSAKWVHNESVYLSLILSLWYNSRLYWEKLSG